MLTIIKESELEISTITKKCHVICDMSFSDYGNINFSSLVSLHTFLNKEKCCLDVLTVSFVYMIVA